MEISLFFFIAGAVVFGGLLLALFCYCLWYITKKEQMAQHAPPQYFAGLIIPLLLALWAMTGIVIPDESHLLSAPQESAAPLPGSSDRSQRAQAPIPGH